MIVFRSRLFFEFSFILSVISICVTLVRAYVIPFVSGYNSEQCFFKISFCFNFYCIRMLIYLDLMYMYEIQTCLASSLAVELVVACFCSITFHADSVLFFLSIRSECLLYQSHFWTRQSMNCMVCMEMFNHHHQFNLTHLFHQFLIRFKYSSIITPLNILSIPSHIHM
jgi:hypothetical protein